MGVAAPFCELEAHYIMHSATCQLNVWKVARKSPKFVLKVFQYTNNGEIGMMIRKYGGEG